MPAYTGLFDPFPNRCFIETGTYYGDGVTVAQNSGKFSEYYSIEFGEQYYEYSVEKYRDDATVHLYFGDSAVELPKMLRHIDTPATFWLDAHGYTYFNAKPLKADACFPLLSEIAAIAAHPIKTHTILIDDMRMFGDEAFGQVTKQQVVDAIMSINPMYRIRYVNGIQAEDIMIASLND